MKTVEPVSVEGRIRIPYRWPAGKLGTHFLAALRDEGKIVAASCAGCRLPHVPPRSNCLMCGEPMTEWSAAGSQGTLHAWTRRGDTLFGAIRLDGVWTSMVHRLVDADVSSLRGGQRVEAVLADRREGSILDIRGFRPVNHSEPSADPRAASLVDVELEAMGRADSLNWWRTRRPVACRSVAILGVAQTRHSERRGDANYAELAFEVVQSLLTRTGLTHGQIDTVVTASSDFWDGRTISDMAVQDAVGAAGKSASKVSMDGVFALAYAAARVNSGAYKTCLVVAHGKASEGDPRLISTAAFDPVFERPLGLDDHAALGLEASQWTLNSIRSNPMTIAELAQAAAEAWNKAARNPNAHRQSTRTAAQVLESPRTAEPLRADMIAPDSDGACAVLLADEETGRRLGASVWLEGFGCATWPHPLRSWGCLSPTPDLGDVARQAREMAGIQRDWMVGRGTEGYAIDVAEVHDASSAQTLLWRDTLQLRKDVLFNPSGGAMGAQPGFATGLVRVAEVYERLARGEGKVGLAHGQTGFVGQAHGVWILRRR